MTDTEAWGQLVSLTDIDSDPISLTEDSFSIGRAKDCDLTFTDNKLVSSRHCCVKRDEEGKVWLFDSSTNGTLVNLRSKVTKGNKKELEHGDEFYIVYKKGEEEKNIGFVYQSMEELAKEDSSEMEQTQEYDTSTDLNLTDATVIDTDVNILDSSHSDEDTSKDQKEKLKTKNLKRPKESKLEDTEEPQKKVSKIENDQKAESTMDASSSNSEENKNKNSKEKTQAAEEINDKETPSTGETSEKEAPIAEETSEKEAQMKSDGRVKQVSSTPAVDEIEETLLCSICQELLYNCISLQPCMHSYCAGCYSDWMQKSNECPTCRMKVKRINKNHIVNNLIEAYLKEHPDKKRPEEDLKALDAKNKITKDMMTPMAQHSYDADEDYSDSDEDEPPNTYVPPRPIAFNPVLPPPPPMLFGIGTPFFGTRPAGTKCRQCPGYVAVPQPGIIQTAINAVGTALGFRQDENTEKEKDGNKDENSEATQSLGEIPGTSTGERKIDPELRDEKIMPEAPNHVCPAFQNHVLCQCCLQPMPDRRAQFMNNGTDVPPQQCTVCYRAYCHAYWGCQKQDCQGCLARFRDLNFGKKCLNNLILENIYESEIFKNYLEAKGITVKQVLRESLVKLDNGKYTCPDQTRYTISSNTPLCFACGLRNFKELAYQYRRDIPKEDLPEDVQKREDCYWGKNCRTQRTRPHHAKNFSHVCDQIRTT